MTTPTIDYFPIDAIWPKGILRTKLSRRTSSPFKVSFGAAVSDLGKEVGLWGIKFLVVGTGLQIGASGKPIFANRSGQDPAVAIQFDRKGKPITFHCDRYVDTRSNVRAISKTLENLRAIERYGASQVLERMFTGLLALPAPDTGPDHWAILGVLPRATEDEIKEAFKSRARDLHPDHGGTTEGFSRLEEARTKALREIGCG